MAKFIKCNTSVGRYFDGHENSPINIELVTKVRKNTYHIYPDNEGAPGIFFHGIQEQWVYNKHGGEVDRDKDYDKIINNEF